MFCAVEECKIFPDTQQAGTIIEGTIIDQKINIFVWKSHLVVDGY